MDRLMDRRAIAPEDTWSAWVAGDTGENAWSPDREDLPVAKSVVG
jgi:hypothetical protein